MSLAPGLTSIKICGVTRLDDVSMIADAGADAIGLNFVPTSPRCVDVATAANLSALATERGLTRGAVVMDLGSRELEALLRAVPVDFVQLHGREPIEMAAQVDLPVIKVTSWTGRDDERELVERWNEATMLDGQRGPRAWLVDAYAPATGGGSGRVARWDLLDPRPAEFAARPMLLAGGLTAENVADAVRATAADGVDTASGVESRPGIKAPDRVRAFVEAARAAMMGSE